MSSLRKKILVVDDTDMARRLGRMLARQEQVNGFEIVTQAEAEKLHLVLPSPKIDPVFEAMMERPTKLPLPLLCDVGSTVEPIGPRPMQFNTRESDYSPLFTGKYAKETQEAAEAKRRRKAARKAAERAKRAGGPDV